MLPEPRKLVSLVEVLGIEIPYQLGARPEEQLKSLSAIEKDGRIELLRSIQCCFRASGPKLLLSGANASLQRLLPTGRIQEACLL